VTVSCSRIVVVDEEHDFFIFAAKPQSEANRSALEQGKKLKLSACEPPLDLSLVMLGFPADRHRRGQPTASEACSVRPRSSQAHKPRNIHEEQLEQKMRDFDLRRPPEYQTRANRVDEHMKVSSLRHNCTTWPGNSGGPILGKGSGDVVVGLPAEALLVERPLDPSIGLRMENMAEFVRRNRELLEQESVGISDEYCSF